MSLIDDFEVRVGDALEELERLPDESVQMCVCSPPYWGLRDYGVEGQLGLEPTPEEYVENLVKVFREVRRVLRTDGTLWLNLGDSYASDKGGTKPPENRWEADDESERQERPQQAGNTSNRNASAIGLKGKDMVGIPWRVAFALQSDGWWLRSDIIWHKPNPMPESVTDRPTSSHEHIFLLAKSERYYYDHEAIKEPNSRSTIEAWGESHERTGGVGSAEERNDHDPDYTGASTCGVDPTGRNKRDVWEVTTKPYPDAHFAVYPPELIVPCVKAGTSQRGQCVECGAPWEREVEQEKVKVSDSKRYSGVSKRNDSEDGRFRHDSETVGWTPACDCDADTEPQLVLDPFAGAGTTGVVCSRLGRCFLGIELNPEYAEMARERIANTERSLFGGE